MSILGKWRIVAMPGYDADYPDMMEPAYILFAKSGSEFAFRVRHRHHPRGRRWRRDRVHLVRQ